MQNVFPCLVTLDYEENHDAECVSLLGDLGYHVLLFCYFAVTVCGVDWALNNNYLSTVSGRGYACILVLFTI